MLVFAFTASTFAQNKFGYLSSSELIHLMPESLVADTAIQKYANELDGLIQQMYVEYQKKTTAAQANSKTMSDAELEVTGRELADLEKRINDFQQTAQDKIDAKQQKLYEPILKKANDAIGAVAKANGYAYIFDSSAGSLLFAEESDNVLPLVKKYLNLKDPAPAKAETPKAPK